MLVKAAIDIGAWWLAAALLLVGFFTMIATGRLFLLAYWRDSAIPEAAAGPAPCPRRPWVRLQHLRFWRLRSASIPNRCLR